MILRETQGKREQGHLLSQSTELNSYYSWRPVPSGPCLSPGFGATDMYVFCTSFHFKNSFELWTNRELAQALFFCNDLGARSKLRYLLTHDENTVGWVSTLPSWPRRRSCHQELCGPRW